VTITTRAAFHHVADLQMPIGCAVPIGCAGVAVYPCDVLVGDRDGVVAIPRALAAEIAGPALEQEQLEAYLHTRIRAGEARGSGLRPNRCERSLTPVRTQPW
jgi:regulator of RNase E activity RraA